MFKKTRQPIQLEQSEQEENTKGLGQKGNGKPDHIESCRANIPTLAFTMSQMRSHGRFLTEEVMLHSSAINTLFWNNSEFTEKFSR